MTDTIAVRTYVFCGGEVMREVVPEIVGLGMGWT